MADTFIPGDYWLISDRSGRKIRFSESRMQWDGLRVHKDEWEPRHPQDFVRSRRDDMSVPDARPRPTDTFIGPLATTVAVAGNAGDLTLSVASTVRMDEGDQIWIAMDSGDIFITTIATINSTSLLTLARRLPGTTAIGNEVKDNTAMALPVMT